MSPPDCPFHSDIARRVDTIEDAVVSVRSCQSAIKTAAAAEAERGKSAHRRLDDMNTAHLELVGEVKDMGKTIFFVMPK